MGIWFEDEVVKSEVFWKILGNRDQVSWDSRIGFFSQRMFRSEDDTPVGKGSREGLTSQRRIKPSTDPG